MPELPEVETIRRQLSDLIPCTIIDFRLSEHFQSLCKREDFQFKKKEKILSIERYAKYLNFNLTSGVMISHLGMSGGWRISKEGIFAKHTHLALKIKKEKNTYYLSYVDPRRFGKMYFLEKKNFLELQNNRPVEIGDEKFNLSHLKTLIKRYPKRMIKPFLLDQHSFPGIGNYMASEICALSFIHPERRAETLSEEDMERILYSIREVISRAVGSLGNSFHGGYRDAHGELGEAKSNMVVFYQKICQLCQKEEVKKIILQGRGTYFCSRCQK